MTGSSTQGIKDRPASRVRSGDGQGGVRRPARRPAADRRVLLSYYVGFEAEGQHIGLVPGGGPQGMTSPVAYRHVPDIEAKLAEVTAAGGTVKEPVRDAVAAAWWPPSPTAMATSSGCSKTAERRSQEQVSPHRD